MFYQNKVITVCQFTVILRNESVKILIAGVHKFSTNLEATSKNQVPKG